MEKLYIVMPAYNEEETIEQVIKEWYPIIEKYNGNGKSRLIIVNDGSKDSTLEKAKKLENELPLLNVIDKQNSGHGATVLYAYNYALKQDADYIFQTDSDGQTRPEEFETFWEKKTEYQAIIGYRNHRKDGFSRIIVTKTLKLILRLIFGLNVTDANTPYRLMKRELLEEYLQDVPKNFNLSNVMLTVLFLYNEENVTFIPITFRQRQGGVNSINIPKITKIGIQAIKDFKVIKKNMKKHKKEENSDKISIK